MKRKCERREPCGNCPFRKDAPLAYWDPREYLMLSRNERMQDHPQLSSPFGCHKDRHEPKERQELCIGWLIYQRERGIPSIALRLILAHHPEVVEQYEQSRSDVELYGSIRLLVRDNIARDRLLNPDRYEGEGGA